MDKGEDGFLDYYRNLYGSRWDSLYEALKLDTPRLAYTKNLLIPYFLDPASILAAQILPLSDGEELLDLCAAPGGKSLVLASSMGPQSTLTSNERSRARRERLKTVLSTHLPEDILVRVRITGFDSSRWLLYEKARYHKVLLDAPCSSERHLINSETHLRQWSPSRSKQLAVKQFALLASALEVVKPEGFLVYCTCSLSPLENDGVIKKLFNKREGKFRIVFPETDLGEQTQFGKLILPDRSKGYGPIYFSLIQRI